MAKSKEVYEWIIGIGGNEVDGVNLHKFVGTENEAKWLHPLFKER